MLRYLLFVLFANAISKTVLGEVTEICSVCSCTGKVIDCRNENLNKSFEEAAWHGFSNSSYEEVIFDNNNIGHLTKFPSLPIVKLSYKYNRLVKIDDRAFKNLTNLEELYLTGNELTSNNLLPGIFEGPYDAIFYYPLKLKLLDLSSNELHTLHPNLFQYFPYLERLYLKRNPFKILDKPTIIAISSAPNLQILDLSFTQIKELPMGFLHTPRKLHELVLRGNYFKEVPSEVLVESHALRILNLNENPIKVLSSERPFPEMPFLKQLHISFMPNLTRIEEGSLRGLKNLDYLYCRMNEKLSYISPKAFIGNDSEETWPNIVKLDLSDNNLRYIDRDFLKPAWKKIKHLNILGNPLVCDCHNQWIVSELIPVILNSSGADILQCAEPSAMKGQRLVNMYYKNYTMRCLDYYGNHPENDGPILISIFVIIILTLIIILGFVIWLKNNNCRQGGPVNYHRAFYRPTKMDDPDRMYQRPQVPRGLCVEKRALVSTLFCRNIKGVPVGTHHLAHNLEEILKEFTRSKNKKI